MKATFVCLLLVCVSPSLAQESSPSDVLSVEVQRVLKFSGTLAYSYRAEFNLSGVDVRFAMYHEPYGGEAYWEETQHIRTDAGGRYTVLLGETRLGGLPPDIFASLESHWLGVRVAGQAEQQRILLVELPSAWKPDPINASAPVSTKEGQPSAPAERYVVLVCLIMFLAGAAMVCVEMVKSRKERMQLDGVFALPLRSRPAANSLRRTAEVFRFPLAEKLRSIRGRFQRSVQSIDEEGTKKAA